MNDERTRAGDLGFILCMGLLFAFLAFTFYVSGEETRRAVAECKAEGGEPLMVSGHMRACLSPGTQIRVKP